MPLSSADLAFVRANTGDVDDNDLYNTDNELHDLYDNQAGSNVNYTIVWALRFMLGKAIRKVNFTNRDTGDTHQRKQERDHIEAQLEYWESLTGLTGLVADDGSAAGNVSVGSFSLGIDEEDDYYTNP